MSLSVKHLTEISDASQKAYDATLRLGYPSDRPNLRASIEAATVKAAAARTIDDWHSLWVLLSRLQKTVVHEGRDLSSLSDSAYGAIDKMGKHFRDASESVSAVITLLSKLQDSSVVRTHITQLGVHPVAASAASPDGGSPNPTKAAETPAVPGAAPRPAEQSGTPADHESPDAPSDETSSSSHRSVGGKRRH